MIIRSLLLITFYITLVVGDAFAANPAIIFGASGYAKNLASSGIELSNGDRWLELAADPTVVAVDAPQGSFGTFGPNLYIKQDNGSSTNWTVAALGVTSPTTTQGDIIVRGAAVDERLAIGTDGQVLTSDGTTAGWETFVATLSLLDQGSLITSNGVTNGQLLVGTDGQVLTANSAAADGSGLEWQTPASGSPTTTNGDMIYYNSGDQRLPIGTNGQILTVAAGLPSWAAAPVSTTLTAKGDIQTHDGINNATLPVGIDGTFLVADSAELTGNKWENINLGGSAGGLTWDDTYPCNGTGSILYTATTFEVTTSGGFNPNCKTNEQLASGAGWVEFEFNSGDVNSSNYFGFISGSPPATNGYLLLDYSVGFESNGNVYYNRLGTFGLLPANPACGGGTGLGCLTDGDIVRIEIAGAAPTDVYIKINGTIAYTWSGQTPTYPLSVGNSFAGATLVTNIDTSFAGGASSGFRPFTKHLAKGGITTHDGSDNIAFEAGTDGDIIYYDSATGTGLNTKPYSPLTTKGDLYTFDTAEARLPVGTDGSILVADSTQTEGLVWSDSLAGTLNPVTDWETCTTNGTWTTNTTYNCQYKRVGDDAIFKLSANISGGAPSPVTGLDFDMPTGFVVDQTKLELASSFHCEGTGNTSSNGTRYHINACWATSNIIRPRFGTTNNQTASLSPTVPNNYGNGDGVEVTIRLPIQGWTSGVDAVAQNKTLTALDVNELTARISPTGVVTSENYDWIDGDCTNVSTGRLECNFVSGIFTEPPAITCTADNDSASATTNCEWDDLQTTRFEIILEATNAGAFVRKAISSHVKASKQGADALKRNFIVADVKDSVSTPNSGNGKARVCSWKATASAVVSNEIGDCILSSSDGTNGEHTYNWNVGYWGSPPNCTCIALQGTPIPRVCSQKSFPTTSSWVAVTGNDGAASDLSHTVICHGVAP